MSNDVQRCPREHANPPPEIALRATTRVENLLRSPPRLARRVGRSLHGLPGLAPARHHPRGGPDELGRPGLTAAREIELPNRIRGAVRRRPRSLRPTSATHDSLFKERMPRSSRHTPRRTPGGAGALGSRRRARFGEPAKPSRSVFGSGRSAERTSDASSLVTRRRACEHARRAGRGLPAERAVTRPSAWARRSLERRSSRPRVEPVSPGPLDRAA
jgi:hypothetical protein